MPVIYKDEDGNIVKKGSNGCANCGRPEVNEKILDAVFTLGEAEEVEPEIEIKSKKTTKKFKDEVNTDVS